MKRKILISGRGGCGKSTLTSIISKTLVSQGNKVLVIDLDEGNLGLNNILGVEKPEVTFLDYCGGRPRIMGELQKAMMKGEEAIHILDEVTFDELKEEYTVWNGDLGYIEIGKIEDPDEGCACPMGNLARDFINNIVMDENQVVIVDTAAGIEHIGRGVIEGIENLVTIVDGSNDAVLLANKIDAMAKKASKSHGVILNKIDGSIEDLLKEKLDDGVCILGVLNYMPAISESNINGEELDISDLSGIDKIIAEI